MAAPVIDATPFNARPSISEGSRLLALLNAAESDIRKEFLRLIGRARGLRTLEQIADLFEAGRINEALDVMDEAAPSFVNSIEQAYAAAGASTAAIIRRQNRSLIEFESTNFRSAASQQATRARLVQQLTESARETLNEVLTDGFQRGLRPDQIARGFRSSLGLTAHQQRAVQNYRRALEGQSRDALNRALRDRRFDPTVRRAIELDEPLTARQIDRMVQRYQERFILHRSGVIARTEALRAVHAGDEEMWQQAIERGVVDPQDITTTWVTALDERVRASHSFMNGQQAAFGEPFRSGDGNTLRFPGDPNAPGSDTIQCRCVLDRTIPKRNPRALPSL